MVACCLCAMSGIGPMLHADATCGWGLFKTVSIPTYGLSGHQEQHLTSPQCQVVNRLSERGRGRERERERDRERECEERERE